MGNFQTGLLLMVVGMVTVFAILLIVIYGSRGLIAIVNKVAPQDPAPAPKEKAGEVPAGVKAVLEAAVAQITAGKGHITKITSL